MRQRSELRDLEDDGICRGQRDWDDGTSHGLVLGVGNGNKEAEAELEEKMRSDADGRHGSVAGDSKTRPAALTLAVRAERVGTGEDFMRLKQPQEAHGVEHERLIHCLAVLTRTSSPDLRPPRTSDQTAGGGTRRGMGNNGRTRADEAAAAGQGLDRSGKVARRLAARMPMVDRVGSQLAAVDRPSAALDRNSTRHGQWSRVGHASGQHRKQGG
jgi:hypothetical protein